MDYLKGLRLNSKKDFPASNLNWGFDSLSE